MISVKDWLGGMHLQSHYYGGEDKWLLWSPPTCMHAYMHEYAHTHTCIYVHLSIHMHTNNTGTDHCPLRHQMLHYHKYVQEARSFSPQASQLGFPLLFNMAYHAVLYICH